MGQTTASGSSSVLTRQPFRADIQGLRAVAVGLVVLYHAGLPFVGGGYVGVDVFYVISGFLITNHLLANLAEHGRIRLGQFYARRARRILPASFVVLVLTGVAASIWSAPLQLQSVFEDAIATALYVPNMLFAAQGTNYLADSTPSLYQHYWSLGVEEQFYLVWPALLLIGYVVTRKSMQRLFWVLLGFTIVSFVGGLVLLQISQPWAFFFLGSRAWELALGGLVGFAVASPRWKPSRGFAVLAAWAGLALVIATGLLYSDLIPYPGVAAAAPVLGTAAVIAFGVGSGGWGPTAILSLRPFAFIGAISYSLYLVHWPILIVPTQVGGRTHDLPLWLTVALAVACVPIAWALYRLVEQPGMRLRPLVSGKPWRSLVAAGASSALVVVAASAAIFAVGQVPLSVGTSASAAEARDPPSFTSFVPDNLQPDLRSAARDNPAVYDDGCHVQFLSTEPQHCRYGHAGGAPLVALFGDSHAAQWFPALDRLVEQELIRLVVDTKSGCPSVTIPKLLDQVPYAACDAWRSSVIRDFNEDPPDLIVLANFGASAGFTLGPAHAAAWSHGLETTIDALPESAAVVVLAGTPTLGFIPAVCLSAHLESSGACGVPRGEALDDAIAQAERAAAAAAGASYVSLTDFICGPRDCLPIVGNVLVYRDDNHITATYSAMLSDPLHDALRPALPALQ